MAKSQKVETPKFAVWTFRAAGIWGLIALLPLFFQEGKWGLDYPPAINHPEFFYAFTTVALAWQVLFLILARDPVRFRPMMVPSMCEKFLTVAAIAWLHAGGRVPSPVFGIFMLDLAWGTLFVIAYLKTPTPKNN